MNCVNNKIPYLSRLVCWELGDLFKLACLPLFPKTKPKLILCGTDLYGGESSKDETGPNSGPFGPVSQNVKTSKYINESYLSILIS